MVGGGLYLCWMGYQMLRGALKKSAVAAPEPQVELARSGRSFLKGLLTNLANPKAIIYFGSVFSCLSAITLARASAGDFPADCSGNAGLVYRGRQPVRPTDDASRLPANGKMDRRHCRHALCRLRHSSDHFALSADFPGLLQANRDSPVRHGVRKLTARLPA